MGTSKGIVIRICETILIFVVILVGFSLSKDKHHAWGVADLLPTDCGIFAYLSGLTRREWATDAGVTFFPTDVAWVSKHCVGTCLLAVVRDCANINYNWICMYMHISNASDMIELRWFVLYHCVRRGQLIHVTSKYKIYNIYVWFWIYTVTYIRQNMYLCLKARMQPSNQMHVSSRGVTENCSWDQARHMTRRTPLCSLRCSWLE